MRKKIIVRHLPLNKIQSLVSVSYGDLRTTSNKPILISLIIFRFVVRVLNVFFCIFIVKWLVVTLTIINLVKVYINVHIRKNWIPLCILMLKRQLSMQNLFILKHNHIICLLCYTQKIKGLLNCLLLPWCWLFTALSFALRPVASVVSFVCGLFSFVGM